MTRIKVYCFALSLTPFYMLGILIGIAFAGTCAGIREGILKVAAISDAYEELQ